jgi:hypothetical protein
MISGMSLARSHPQAVQQMLQWIHPEMIALRAWQLNAESN